MAAAGESTTADTGATPNASKLQAALAGMQQNVKELLDYAKYYAELHWDQLKLTILKYALLAVLGIVMATLGMTLLITGGIVLVIGLSYSLAEWFFDGNGAFGLLLGGALFVLPVLLTIIIGIAVIQGRVRAQLGHKYEAKKREQRARYGHDVEQRAALAP